MVVIDSVEFFDEFTGSGGGGSPRFNGRILDKMYAEINFHFHWEILAGTFIFTAVENTIVIGNNYSFLDFVKAGFRAGDTIEINGSGSNDGTHTVVSVTESTITTSTALVTETADAVDIRGTTPLTSIDFFYNLIGAEEDIHFTSLTDSNTTQRYYTDVADETNLTPVNLNAGTISYGWLTQSGASTIVGTDAGGDFKQSFKITHYFNVAPFFLKGQQTNFENITPPDYFRELNNLKYVFKIQGKPSADYVETPHSIEEEYTGASAWFNASNNGRRANYSLTSMTWKDMSDATIDAPDLNLENKGTIVIASDAKFSASSELYLSFFLCPNDPEEYTDTTTTLPQNFKHDRKFFQVGAASSNGDNYGTDYQALTTITSVLNSTSQITINFRIDLSTATKNLLKEWAESDRMFAIVVTTQDPTITTTTNVDRTAILAEYLQFDYDQDDDTLCELVDYIHCYHYPNIGVDEGNNIAGYEGDPIYVQIPFRVETAEVDGVSPTIESVSVQVVATRSGYDDFICERKDYDTSLIRKFDGIQTINLTDTRNYKTYEGDPYNECYLVADSSYDDGTMKGFIVQQALVLNYAFWSQKVSERDGNEYDIFKTVRYVNDAWRYMVEYGWDLSLRLVIKVTDRTGYTTEYNANTSINILPVGDPSSEGGLYSSSIEYYILDDNGDEMQVEGIQKGGSTLIKAIFSGNYETQPAGYDGFYGYIFADRQNQGGVTDRRFASTEFTYESDTPFSVPDEEDGATSSYSNGACRINYFDFTKIVITSWYDDTVDNWTRTASDLILIYPRLGYKADEGDCVRLMEDGTVRLLENETARLLDNCPVVIP